MDSIQLKSQSPYKRGADWGAWFGIYLSALFFATSYSVSYPVCGLLGLLLIVCVPPCIFLMLRKSYIADNGKTIFSSLWMEGIAIFFFGGLIASIVAMVYMRWIEPSFFDTRIDALIELYSEMKDIPQAQEAAELLQTARDQKVLPKPIELTIDMLWLIVFTGSLLSMIMSWLVQLFKVSPSAPNPKNNLR